MKRMRKCMAMALALVLTALSCFTPGMTALAEEQGATAPKEVTQSGSETEQINGTENQKQGDECDGVGR